MAKPPFQVVFLFIYFLFCTEIVKVKATWCVTRSDASETALQNALDYACSSGADCVTILENGLCFLPNTIQAHASYAFNSYYQRRNRAPGSCEFAGTATIAKTDPSKSFFFFYAFSFTISCYRILPSVSFYMTLLLFQESRSFSYHDFLKYFINIFI